MRLLVGLFLTLSSVGFAGTKITCLHPDFPRDLFKMDIGQREADLNLKSDFEVVTYEGNTDTTRLEGKFTEGTYTQIGVHPNSEEIILRGNVVPMFTKIPESVKTLTLLFHMPLAENRPIEFLMPAEIISTDADNVAQTEWTKDFSCHEN